MVYGSEMRMSLLQALEELLPSHPEQRSFAVLGIDGDVSFRQLAVSEPMPFGAMRLDVNARLSQRSGLKPETGANGNRSATGTIAVHAITLSYFLQPSQSSPRRSTS